MDGPALTALATSWLHAPPSRLTGMVRDTLHIQDDTIGRIERHAAVLRALDGQVSGDTLIAVVRAELRLVATLLTEASFTAGIARRLFLTAADLAHLGGATLSGATGSATLDSAALEGAALDTGPAQRHYRAALHAAHAAGDRALGAVCLADLARTLGDPVDAGVLAAVMAQAAGAVAPWAAVPVATVRHYPVADPTGPVRSGQWIGLASTGPARPGSRADPAPHPPPAGGAPPRP